MDTLITHLTLQVVSTVVYWLLTLFTRSTLKTMPHKSLNDVSVQVHAGTVSHDTTLGALQ